MTSATDRDSDALRSFLKAQFSSMSCGVTAAAEVAGIVQRVVDGTIDVMRECVRHWNARNAVQRFPDEILAACFALLPLRDRFSASQVSHAWRSVALAYPSVWSNISLLTCIRDPVAILDATLSRSGQSSVDLHCRRLCQWRVRRWYPPGEAPSAQISPIVQRHLVHIQSISWYDNNGTPQFPALVTPAPLLASLYTDEDLALPPDFLGGMLGKLRTLHLGALSLPPSCPALATVTQLHCNVPNELSDPAVFRNLFHVFPRLESLSLLHLCRSRTHLMPPGPVPRTLVHLRLDSQLGDIAAQYIAWRTERLTRVELAVWLTAEWLVEYNPAVLRLSAAATHIVIALPRNADSATPPIGAEDGATDIECDDSAPDLQDDNGSLTLRDGTDTTCAIQFFCGYEGWTVNLDCFSQLVRALSLDSLRSLSTDCALLPALLDNHSPRDLAHLALTVRDEAGSYPWTTLSALPAHFSHLRTLRLEVQPPPSLRDGRDLIEVLASLGATHPLEVEVHGFLGEIVAQLQPLRGVGDELVLVEFHV
ncbi:hypothetical protein AURDEDRAFT_166504 [Auricularia subglabra TFB-10046 SS5]|nr:hypothetical protein AURDEDRAFT_166504 [Auricularia subglabra TFB-10046 SS5]